MSVVDNHLIDMEQYLLKACKEQRVRIAELETSLRSTEQMRIALKQICDRAATMENGGA